METFEQLEMCLNVPVFRHSVIFPTHSSADSDTRVSAVIDFITSFWFECESDTQWKAEAHESVVHDAKAHEYEPKLCCMYFAQFVFGFILTRIKLDFSDRLVSLS